MKYSKEQRNEIGRLVYTKELTIGEACKMFDINRYTVRDYMRDYRDANQLPPMSDLEQADETKKTSKRKNKTIKYNDLATLSRDALIDEVIKARVEAERAKKGYAVKGGGQEKEFINLFDVNSK